jgi:hypothetical protein
MRRLRGGAPEVPGSPVRRSWATRHWARFRELPTTPHYAVGGYELLVREGRRPVWHHHLARPLGVSLAVCVALMPIHVAAAVAAGALTYFVALAALGGIRLGDLRVALGRNERV